MKHREGKVDWIKVFYDSAAEWWGISWYNRENLKERLEIIQRYGNQYDKRILELGAGTGETASYLCDHEYCVTAVDICKKNIELMSEMKKNKPLLSVVEGDFLKVKIEEKFPIICMFETFGLGSDKDQRKLLRRINKNWLQYGGILILDVYHPYGPIKAAGTKRVLDKLDNIPGSVEMTDLSFYDGIKNRWVDVWEPVKDKQNTRIQSIRCYSPADLFLLMEGTGFIVHKILYKGKEIDFQNNEIRMENAFEDEGRIFFYTAILKRKMK